MRRVARLIAPEIGHERFLWKSAGWRGHFRAPGGAMLTFITRRILGLVLTLLAVSLVVFTVLEVLPGDVAQVILGTEAREDTLAALRTQLGLDRPAHVRYLAWIGGLATGDFGVSHTYDVPVAELIGERLAVTAPLALMAFALSSIIAVPLGMFAARRRGRLGDYGIMAFSQAGLAIPNFWFAILLILVFAVWLRWMPAGGFPGWDAGLGPAVHSLILPACALALTESAILARVTRSAVLETLEEDYVRTARAKGLAWGSILWRHVLRNALIPVTTIMGLQFAFLLAGAVIVENVFTLPGLGRLVLQAIFQRDVVVVKDAVLVLAGMVVLVNFLVDVLYAAIDPRPKVEL
jgi:peptide/nickel transport system permease protein